MTEMLPGTDFSIDTVQWRLGSIQMINWGGFQGYHRADFASGPTLISGASGTGKSTVLDAYTAIMMPASVPFNGASNDATNGRARGAEQRNLVTYLRGKTDSYRDGDMTTDQVLRGDGEDTWGVLAADFVNDLGQHFTALRTYFAAASNRFGGDVAQKWFTLDGTIMITDLVPLAATRFDPRLIRARFSGLASYGGVTEFNEAVTRKLGIGAKGKGEKALLLLSRIQGGHQVRTVDRLYKELVLERPRTFASADLAVEHFDELDQTYKELEVSGQKEQHLHRIDELHEQYQKARARAERLDRFGVTRDGDTPFRLWQLQTERSLLDQAETANKAARQRAESNQIDARVEVGRLKTELGQVEEQQRANGGGMLDQISGQIEQAQAERTKVQRSRLIFETRTKVLQLAFSDEASFSAAQASAEAFLRTAGEQATSLRDARDELVRARPALASRLQTLVEEHASLTRRQSLVPMDFDEVRNQIAQACGVRPTDLPFAAELIDIAPEYEDWRLAAELTLRGVGLTLLMDERRQRQIRETIEPLPLSPRVNFEGVRLGEDVADPTDRQYLSGRLVFKSSPFIGWVKRRVQQRGVDHCCVDSAADLGGEEPKVTINGQVSRGSRGAHGRNRGQGPILGFSNEARRREIEEEATSLRARLDTMDRDRGELEDRITAFTSRVEAHREVANQEWASLDLERLDLQIERLSKIRDELLAKSDVLAQLKQRHEQISTALDAGRRRLYGCEEELKTLDSDWGEIVDRQDVVTRESDRIEHAGQTVLTEADAEHLTEQLVSSEQAEVDHARLGTAVARLKTTLTNESNNQRNVARRLGEQLEEIFERYNQAWPDPNRGSTVDSYEEFAAIHEEILKHGLHERREIWKRKLQGWSGNDLKLLHEAFDDALGDIEDRLGPVNEILRRLPFGADHDRLRIDMRRLHPEKITQFRKRLRTLASNTTMDWTDVEAEERFLRLRSFMAEIRKPKSGEVSEREELLDVTRHIEITASRVGSDGRQLSIYSALGGKSGGESQELAAFIVGAALRYQLGDETGSRPRFAPVLLDEGFVKADGEFTRRAVAAWQMLGFQLIIGAPLEKVTGLEPYMELNLAVTKNRDGYSFVAPFKDLAKPPAMVSA